MSRCKSCGGSVNWKQENGKWQCYDPSGKVHWDTCSQNRWDQVVSTGTEFSTKKGDGYRNSVHGTKYKMKKDIPAITGKHYKPLCNCPKPWEHCQHTVTAYMIV